MKNFVDFKIFESKLNAYIHYSINNEMNLMLGKRKREKTCINSNKTVSINLSVQRLNLKYTFATLYTYDYTKLFSLCIK